MSASSSSPPAAGGPPAAPLLPPGGPPPQVIVFVPGEGEPVSVDREAALQSSCLIRDLLDGEDDTLASVEIPVPCCTSAILSICGRYMTYRKNNKARELERPLRQPLVEVLDEQDKQLIQSWDEQVTLEVLKAANFFLMQDLRDLAAARVAQYLVDKNVGEIRAMFGLDCDFTPEEEAMLKKELGA